MTIAFDWIGAYLEHKVVFDEMAKSMQLAGHKVGIITGEREKRKPQIMETLGFPPDFMCLWTDEEFIVNGNHWKAVKLDENNVDLYFDDDANSVKKFTSRWVVKTLNNADIRKF